MKALRRLDRGTRLTLLALSVHPVALLVKFRKTQLRTGRARRDGEDAPASSTRP